MDLALLRSLVRLPYTAARLPLTLLDERVVARYWDQDALGRVGFEFSLGSLDLVAGRLLGDDGISQRGRVLMRLTGDQPPVGDEQADARAVTRAVLQALAEQVSDDAIDLFDRLASQLPGDLQTALWAGDTAGQPLPLGAFYQRVSDLAGVPPDQAEACAREVVAALQAEVVGAPLAELFERLPQEYRSLLPEQPRPGDAGDFLRRVQHLGELSSREEAETATRLTLSALGDRISGGQAASLAGAVPGELRLFLEQTAEPAQAFGIEEFLRRIAAPQQIDPQTARRQAKAVLHTMREHTPAEEIADTVAQLPPDLASLLS